MLFDNWPCVLRVRTTEQEKKTSGFIVQLTTKRFTRQCIEIEEDDGGGDEEEEEREKRKTGGRICFSRVLPLQGRTGFYRLWCKPWHWQVQREKRHDVAEKKLIRFDVKKSSRTAFVRRRNNLRILLHHSVRSDEKTDELVRTALSHTHSVPDVGQPIEYE